MNCGMSCALADSATSVSARLRRTTSVRALSTHQVAARRYRETRRGHAPVRGEGARILPRCVKRLLHADTRCSNIRAAVSFCRPARCWHRYEAAQSVD
jgi:hypothetical protein